MTELVLAQEEVRQLNATSKNRCETAPPRYRLPSELGIFPFSFPRFARAALGMAGCGRALQGYSDKLDPAALDWIRLIQRDAEHRIDLWLRCPALARITQTKSWQPLDLLPWRRCHLRFKPMEPDRKVRWSSEDIRGFGDPALLRVVMET